VQVVVQHLLAATYLVLLLTQAHPRLLVLDMLAVEVVPITQRAAAAQMVFQVAVEVLITALLLEVLALAVEAVEE
jgi:hypothetical protein